MTGNGTQQSCWLVGRGACTSAGSLRTGQAGFCSKGAHVSSFLPPMCRMFTLLQTGRMKLDPKGGWKHTDAVQVWIKIKTLLGPRLSGLAWPHGTRSASAQCRAPAALPCVLSHACIHDPRFIHSALLQRACALEPAFVWTATASLAPLVSVKGAPAAGLCAGSTFPAYMPARYRAADSHCQRVALHSCRCPDAGCWFGRR